MKFNIDDRVMVVKNGDPLLGQVGKIIDIDPDWVYPYEIQFDDESLNGLDCETLFAEEDIELEAVVQAGVHDANTHYYVDIKWQEGTVEENGINGTQIEDVIDILVERLQGFQNGAFPCRENALAITHLQEAQNWLYRRTMERKKQGVEGKYQKHK
jgi:hypothetical protein